MSIALRSMNRARGLFLVAFAGMSALVWPIAGCELFVNGTINVPDDNGDDGDDDGDGTTQQFAVFTDAQTGFSTSDVRDVDEEIVRFDTDTKAIVWAEDSTSFQEGTWTVDGVFLAGGGFQVRFGTKDGEQRAYFTETANGFICEIEPLGAFISISGTNVPVPQE